MTGPLRNTEDRSGRAQARREAGPNALLRAARHQRGWTQQALADLLGTTPLAINRWEQGKALPGAYFRTRLCDLFGLSEAELGLAPRETQTSLTSLWLVPYRRNPFFTGRQELLTHLHALLATSLSGTSTSVYALCGLGGIGKTQTALEYCYRFGAHYQAVIWLHAETRDLLWADLATLAERLTLVSSQEPEQRRVVEAVRRWLQEQSGWLLVLDNVEEATLLAEVLPAQWNGHVLLTTRSQYTGALAERLDLTPLSPEEGTRLLLHRSKLLAPGQALEAASERQRLEARAIVERLDGLPLALDQVGAYLEETGCELADYLPRYERHRLALLQRRGRWSGEHPHSVAATVELACQQVGPEALELLSLCAFLHTDAIPEEIITEGQAHLGPVLQAMAADPYRLDEAIGTLRAYSLLQREAQQKLLTMHRLVQAVLRDRLTSEEQQQLIERLIRALHQVFPTDALQETVEYWQRCEYLLPHALEELALSQQKQIVIPEVAGLLTKTATYLRQRARYSEAESLYQRALLLQEQLLEPEHPDTAWTLEGLAELYQMRARYAEAESLYQRALRIQEQSLGPEHPDLAWTLEGLADMYNKQSRYAEAEPLLLQALHIWEQARGPEYSRVAGVLIALATLCTGLGRYAEAEPLLLRALHIWEQTLGSEHPQIVIPLSNLGLLYDEQGRYAEAEPLLLRTLHIWEQTQGSDHPDLAGLLNNLGFLYNEQGRYNEAEPLLLRSLHIREQAQGPDHPELTPSLNNLGFLYNEQGRYNEAEPLLLRSLRIAEQGFGSDHPQVAVTLRHLGALRHAQGHDPEAEELYQRALHIWEQALGPEHPRVTRALIGLAELYNEQGRISEAESFLLRSLQILEQGLTPQHPNLARVLANLGTLYAAQGRSDEAELLLQRAVHIAEQTLSADSSQPGRFLRRLGALYSAQERYAEAEDLYQRALLIWEQVAEPEDAEYVSTLTELAELYRQQGRTSETEALLLRAEQRREHV